MKTIYVLAISLAMNAVAEEPKILPIQPRVTKLAAAYSDNLRTRELTPDQIADMLQGPLSLDEHVTASSIAAKAESEQGPDFKPVLLAIVGKQRTAAQKECLAKWRDQTAATLAKYDVALRAVGIRRAVMYLYDDTENLVDLADLGPSISADNNIWFLLKIDSAGICHGIPADKLEAQIDTWKSSENFAVALKNVEETLHLIEPIVQRSNSFLKRIELKD